MLKINYGTGTGNEKVNTLEEAMETADKNASYTGKNISIENEEGECIIFRKWNPTRDNIEEQENPIDFGNFGYYADWEEL